MRMQSVPIVDIIQGLPSDRSLQPPGHQSISLMKDFLIDWHILRKVALANAQGLGEALSDIASVIEQVEVFDIWNCSVKELPAMQLYATCGNP